MYNISSTLIKKAEARTVFDSTGQPTIEVEIELEDGTVGLGSAPRGSTVGGYECVQILDNEEIFGIKGVKGLIGNFKNKVAPHLIGIDVANLFEIDKILIQIDGTVNKSNLGGNLTLAVSIAALSAYSNHIKKPVYQIIGNKKTLPSLMFNMFDGTKGSKVSGIEGLLIIQNIKDIEKELIKASAIQQELENRLFISSNGIRSYSNQGACVSHTINSPTAMLELLNDSTLQIDNENENISFGLDLANSDNYIGNQRYNLKWQSTLHSSEMEKLYINWISNNKVTYLEDLYADTDYKSWASSILMDKCLVAGDDLYATNTSRLQEHYKLANTVVIKPNQIGTIMETVECIKVAKECGLKTVISQRTSEIESTIITQIAIATGIDFLKAGGMRRLDRVAKYNDLLRVFKSNN